MKFDITKDFVQAVPKLSHNPLGIIALFLLLVYGIASLFFGLSSAGLELCLKIPFIWFLILFPVMLLWAFTWLVTHHHEKLYSPTDYRDDINFLRAMGIDDQRKKLDDEFRAINEQSLEAQITEDNTTLGKTEKTIEAKKYKHNYLLAEDLAIRKLESDLNVSIKRNLAFHSEAIHIQYDGIFYRGKNLYAIEVKYLSKNKRYREILRNLVSQASSLQNEIRKKNLPNSLELIVVLVTELTPEANTAFKSKLSEELINSKIPVQIIVYNLDELKISFGLV